MLGTEASPTGPPSPGPWRILRWVVILGFLLLPLVLAGSQTDEDLIFEEDGVIRVKRENTGEVLPVASPVHIQEVKAKDPSEEGILSRFRRQWNFFGTSDDDELEGSALVDEEGSGEVPRTFRVKLEVTRPWQPVYADKTSYEFSTLARNLRTAFESILRDITGEITIQVSDMRASVQRFILATVDVMHIGDYSQKSRIRRAIREKLGEGFMNTIPVSTQQFSFEDHSASSVLPACPPGKLQCASGRCATPCDGVAECLDAADERGCEGREGGIGRQCPPGQFECEDQLSCVENFRRCDGTQDCADNSDEKGCEQTTTPRPRCYGNQFQCNTGECLEEFRRCDYIDDCPGGEDELACPCDSSQFECISGMCIALDKQCDGSLDCDDGSDEDSCPCLPPRFECRSGMCVSGDRRCDGRADCDDGSDEEGCLCPSDQFTCEDGTCVSIDMRCDGRVNCGDGSDEWNCPSGTCSPPDGFLCNNGYCISGRQHCDGTTDCQDGSDEYDCPCRPDQFRCNDGQCLEQYQRCNGVRECRGGEDEAGCGCQPNEFRCVSDGYCIPEDRKCDGRFDCADASDEGPECRSVCPPNEWRCSDGECIPSAYRCDGRPDCRDGSDEYIDCPPPPSKYKEREGERENIRKNQNK